MSPAVFVCSVCVFVVFFHSKEQDYGHLENGECNGHWVVVKSFQEPSQLFDHCVCNMDFCSNGLVKIGGRENINTAQKSFSLKFSSANMTKFAENCGLGHIH